LAPSKLCTLQTLRINKFLVVVIVIVNYIKYIIFIEYNYHLHSSHLMTKLLLLSLMERIPFDIWINHILPYTYNMQPSALLEDMRNFCAIKSAFQPYDTEIIKHELVSIATMHVNRQKLDTILTRHWLFQMKFNQFDGNMFYKYSKNTKFHILFGLFTAEERTSLAEYIFREIANWI